MFDDLKEKIDDLVSSIKSKLPGSKSDDDDDEYEDEEGEFDEKTEEINIAQKVAESDEYDEEEYEDDDDDDDDDEDEAKAKKQKVMRLGLIGLVLVLGASILMDPGEDDTTVPDVKPVVRKNRPKRKKKVVEKAEVKAPVEQDGAIEKPAEVQPAKETAEAPVEEPLVEDNVQAPDENVQITQNKLELVDNEPEIEATAVTPVDEETSETQSSELGEESVTQQSDENEKGSEMSEAIDNLTTTEPSGMIEKVVKEKLEYQEPPNYLETGRGLVYNCSGKHWACVDQVSFVNCKKNSDWSAENDKDPECYPSNVYESFKDCRTIQIYNINTNLETSFCKK